MTPGSLRRGLIWRAATLLCGLGLALGLWQLQRAETKRIAQVQLGQRAHAPAWRNADWPCDRRAPDTLPTYQPAQLRGVWWPERTVVLENRPQGGRVGFEVLTPLRLWAPGQRCDGRLVLVQRGWLPRDPQDRQHVPPVSTPPGLVVVVGHVGQLPSRVYQLGQEAPPLARSTSPLIRQNVDARFWQDWLGQSPLPGVLVQVQAEAQPEPGTQALQRDWPAPDLGRDRHLAYAAQWFALSALVAGLTIWFQLVRPRRLPTPIHDRLHTR